MTQIDLYSTPSMSALFSPQAHIQYMLTFEAALARAQARAALFPPSFATSIEVMCKAELFDVAALYREAAIAGTPAIPLVQMLTLLVEGQAKNVVHWGATSQDAIDTALMLQMQKGLALLIERLYEICSACALLTEHHRHTLMVGRTLLQQALPITFGLKTARWLALVVRQIYALHEHRAHTVAVQLGGAAGTLASLGEKGLQVITLLAEELNLPAPDLPWHTERDRVVEIAMTLGIVAGAMAKIAGDIALLAQTEVGEVAEGSVPGKGGSSALPHKHNPVDAVSAIAAARLANGVIPVLLSAMAQEHERAIGGWQAEWEAIPSLFRFTASAVDHVLQAVSGLQVDAARMRENITLTHGLIMAESLTMVLASHIDKSEARQRVQAACEQALQSGKTLRQIVETEARLYMFLSSEEIDHALNPASYLGSTDAFIDRALASYHTLQSARGEK